MIKASKIVSEHGYVVPQILIFLQFSKHTKDKNDLSRLMECF